MVPHTLPLKLLQLPDGTFWEAAAAMHRTAPGEGDTQNNLPQDQKQIFW